MTTKKPKAKKDNHSYYHFNSDWTIGYVSKSKMERMIKGWGWKREDFVIDTEIFKLIKPPDVSQNPER